MAMIFWESTQRARNAYWCDWCRTDILPGQLYERKFWSNFRGGLRNKLMCEHVDPPCPRDHDIREPDHVEREELGVPMVLMLENRLVQKVLVGGEVVTETEATVVLREAPAAPLYADLYGGSDGEGGDDDVPF
jgi:hypothetical protein